MGVPQEKKGTENIFEDIMVENFPHLGRETDIQIQEAKTVPKRINLMRSIQRHLLIERVKIKYKKKELKAVREKNQVLYKETPIRLLDNFPAKILQGEKGVA